MTVGKCLISLCTAVAISVTSAAVPSSSPPAELGVVVMDPLSKQLACACVAGYAQRDYLALGDYLSSQLAMPVKVVAAASVAQGVRELGREADLIVAKQSVVAWAASHGGPAVRRIAMLSGKDGLTTQQGLFVVRSADRAKTTADLKGRKLVFGPPDCDEKYGAALAALRRVGIVPPRKPRSLDTCIMAALAVVERQADAAVISGYAYPLLAGCGTIKAGALRIVGRTAPVPFVAVYARADLDRALCDRIAAALLTVRSDIELKRKMETRDGFVLVSEAPARAPRSRANPAPPTAPTAARPDGWTDWRGGPSRDGFSTCVPTALPAAAQFVWRVPLASQALGGVTVAGERVLVADKLLETSQDVWRCLDARSGREVWRFKYLAPGKMEYTTAPRAAPVVSNGTVYLQGAFGHLAAVDLRTGLPVWRCDLRQRFGAQVPTWGFCSAPLVVDGKVIVNPGAPPASLAALDVVTGRTLWARPGARPSYGNLIVAALGGRRQIVGHDAVSLNGWDIATGERLWTVRPPLRNDFNVPTPVAVGGKLLVATENNGTRLYRFRPGGRINPTPVATNMDARPDTGSPVVTGRSAWVATPNGLYCLSLANGLRTVWHAEDPDFLDHASLISGGDRVLVLTKSGRLCLLPAEPAPGAAPVGLTPFAASGADSDLAVWSHPALVGRSLFVRTHAEVACLQI